MKRAFAVGRRDCRPALLCRDSPATDTDQESTTASSINTKGPGRPSAFPSAKALDFVANRDRRRATQVMIVARRRRRTRPNATTKSGVRHGSKADIIMGASTTPSRLQVFQCRQ